MRVGIVLLMVLVVVLSLMACGNVSVTPTVQEAIGLGYTPEIEACSNRTDFPDLYAGVPYIDLGDGVCEFYYPPSAYTTP